VFFFTLVFKYQCDIQHIYCKNPTMLPFITIYEISCLFMKGKNIDSFCATLFITRTHLDRSKLPSACSLSGSVSCLRFFYDVITIYLTHCYTIKYSFFTIILYYNLRKYLYTKWNIRKMLHQEINDQISALKYFIIKWWVVI